MVNIDLADDCVFIHVSRVNKFASLPVTAFAASGCYPCIFLVTFKFCLIGFGANKNIS